MPNLFFTPILNPPLASTSTRTAGKPIRFYACMQITATGAEVIDPEERFTLVLLHATNGRGAWKPALFREASDADKDVVKLFDIQGEPSNTITPYASETTINSRRDLFVLDLEYDCDQGPLQFCLNYKFSDGPWLRAGSRIGGVDGRIVFQKELKTPITFPEIFSTEGDTQNWHAQLVESDDKESSQIWNVAHKTTKTGILEVPLGRPKHLEQWMALVKIAAPWMGPLHGKASFDISKDALLVVFQRNCDGKHVAVLPVSGIGFGSAYVTSCTSGTGSITVRGMDDYEEPGPSRKVQVIIAVGDDALKTVTAAASYLKKLVMDSECHGLEAVLANEVADLELVDEKRTAWEDGVSYCTWNGLGSNLSESRIIGALEELERSGVKIGNLMIDDTWQSIPPRNYGASGTWSAFEANENFPGGLKGLVGKVRTKFPYIKHIGVWHALHGYWDGITPESTLTKAYKTIEVVWRDNVNLVEKMLTMIAPEDVERFYDDFYKFLKSCGIDSVKTDVQCRIDELKNGSDKAKLARAYQNAYKKSSIKYFDRRVIYCMAHVPQILYHALLPDDDKSVFFRSSDDFYPNIPQSHSWHVFTNAMNMILFGQLNILPDWDMFQSSLPTYNSLHAAARCLSGGPIFLTDIPSEHDTVLINSMASPSPADRTPRALRPSKMAMASDPYVGYHSNRLLQVRNICEHASLLGIFNVSTIPLIELVDMKTGFQNLTIGKEYIVRAHTTGRITEPRRILGGNGDTLLIVELEPSKWEMFTAAPVEAVQVEERIIKVAALGIKENITGAAALVDSRVYKGVDKNIVVVQADVCALGVLVVYISDIAQGRTLDNISVLIGEKLLPKKAYSFLNLTLEIDLLSAWESMGISEGHAGEDAITVSVELS